MFCCVHFFVIMAGSVGVYMQAMIASGNLFPLPSVVEVETETRFPEIGGPAPKM